MENKKKCKYCMSKIDVEATVCPHCRRRQPKQKIKRVYTEKEKILFPILIPIAIILFFLAIRGISLVISGYNDVTGRNIGKSKKQIFEEKVNSYLSSTKSQFRTDDSDKDYMCYYIDVGDYTGSVRVKKDSRGDLELYIWLSDGTYYASGYEDDVKIVKSSNTAPTNCHIY